MDLSDEVLKGFGITTRNIKKVKGMYICTTKAGLKVIKSTNQPLEKISKSQEIIKYLQKSNIKTMDNLTISSQDEPYFLYRDMVYTCGNYSYHEKNDFTKEAKLLEVVKNLALLHKALSKTTVSIKLENSLEDVYKKNLKDLQSIKKKVNKQTNFSNFDLAFVKNCNFYIEDILQSLDFITSEYFNEKTNLARENKSIIHNLVKEENFIKVGNDFYINNFIDISSNVNLIDIGEVIQRYIKLKEEGQNIEFEKIIESYCTITPLTNEDINIIKAIVIYPKRFIKTILSYYMKNRTWTPTGLEIKLEKELKNREIYRRYVGIK